MSEEIYLSSSNRVICDVLEEMRKCYSTCNFSYLLGLIEEVQSMVNKMESALYDKGNVIKWSEIRSKLKKELKTLQKEIKALELKKGFLKEKKK